MDTGTKPASAPNEPALISETLVLTPTSEPGPIEIKSESAPAPVAPKRAKSLISSTEKLNAKIAAQARQLQELAAYKLICEKHILELSPKHPLPVLPAHLGKTGGKSEESKKSLSKLEQDLHLSLQKNQQLQDEVKRLKLSRPADQTSVVGRVIQVQKEKQTLESALRAEMLAGEEQRSYIEILKQALQAKIEDLGFSDILNQARVGRQPANSVDIFAEMATIKKTADVHRKECSRFEGEAIDFQQRVKELSVHTKELGTENAGLREELAREQEDLQNTLGALEEARTQVRRLEEEKNGLIESAREMSERQQATEEVIRCFEADRNQWGDDKAQYEKACEELRQQLKRTEETAAKDSEGSNERVEELGAQLAVKAVECEKLMKEFVKCNTTIERLNKEAEDWKRAIEAREQTIVGLRKEQEELSAANQEAIWTQEKKKMEEQLEAQQKSGGELRTKNEELTRANRNLQENYAALTQTLEEMQADTERLSAEKGKLEDETKECQKQLASLKEELATALKKAEAEQQSSSHYRDVYEDVKKEISSLREIEKAAEELKADYEKLKKSCQEQADTINDLHAKLASETLQSDELKADYEKLKKSCKEQVDTIDDLRKKLASKPLPDEKAAGELKADYENLKKSCKEQADIISDLHAKLASGALTSKEKADEIAILRADFEQKLAAAREETVKLTHELETKTADLNGIIKTMTERNGSLEAELIQTKSQVEALKKMGEEDQREDPAKHVMDTCLEEVAEFAQHEPAALQNASKAFRELVSTMFARPGDLQQAAKRIAEYVRASLEEIRDGVCTEARKAEREENERLRAQLKAMQANEEKLILELKNRITTSDQDTALMTNTNERLDLLAGEKHDTELLLARVSAALPSLDMRNFVGELAKTQSELHAARRERQRLAAIVAQFSDTKSAAELARCESVIDAAQKRFKTLDEALKKTELASQPETMLVENARERIAELQGEAEELVQEIERLRTDNVMLRETNCKLLSEREELVLSAHSVPSKHHYSEHGLRPQASQSVLMRSGESADKEEYDPAEEEAAAEIAESEPRSLLAAHEQYPSEHEVEEEQPVMATSLSQPVLHNRLRQGQSEYEESVASKK